MAGAYPLPFCMGAPMELSNTYVEIVQRVCVVGSCNTGYSYVETLQRVWFVVRRRPNPK